MSEPVSRIEGLSGIPTVLRCLSIVGSSGLLARSLTSAASSKHKHAKASLLRWLWSWLPRFATVAKTAAGVASFALLFKFCRLYIDLSRGEYSFDQRHRFACKPP